VIKLKTDLKERISKLPLDLQLVLVSDVRAVIESDILPPLEFEAQRRRRPLAERGTPLFLMKI
jgi:hypothetical protein